MLQFYLVKIINALNLTMPTSTISVICSIFQIISSLFLGSRAVSAVSLSALFYSRIIPTFAPNIIAEYIYEHQHEDIIWSIHYAVLLHNGRKCRVETAQHTFILIGRSAHTHWPNVFSVFERLFQLVIQFFRHCFQPLVAMALLYFFVVGEMLKP